MTERLGKWGCFFFALVEALSVFALWWAMENTHPDGLPMVVTLIAMIVIGGMGVIHLVCGVMMWVNGD